mgnify:CR=1 FL=1
MGKLKNFLLWNYSRETSVYVIFCLAIVAFIFLTPKSWFVGRGTLATRTNTVTVKATEVTVDKNSLQIRVREITGDPKAEVIGWKEITQPGGEKVYEVEIE